MVKGLSKKLCSGLKTVILAAMRGEMADFDASVHASIKASTNTDALCKADQGRAG